MATLSKYLEMKQVKKDEQEHRQALAAAVQEAEHAELEARRRRQRDVRSSLDQQVGRRQQAPGSRKGPPWRKRKKKEKGIKERNKKIKLTSNSRLMHFL